MIQKIILFISMGLVYCTTINAQQNSSATYNEVYQTYPSYTDNDIITRLNQMTSGVVPPRFDNIVKSYVNTYTKRKRDKTEAMLGKRVIYFPIFEEHIRAKGLPLDLKYLPVVESALNPIAVSRAGATGLWQFMPGTAEYCGLTINSLVDERSDPHKSTDAALEYLYKQYRRYGSWELALAAYNGGPGRVNRAVKRGRSKDFWKIKKYLPTETRNYVSAFVAASYILNYFHLHGLEPLYPIMDLHQTDKVKIYDRLSFDQISMMTGTPLYIIESLNPSYKQNIIPSSSNGNYLILPSDKIGVFNGHARLPDSGHSKMIAGSMRTMPSDDNHVTIRYTITSGDNLASLADAYLCSEQDLVHWNSLINTRLYPGQQIVIYYPKRNPEDRMAAEPISAKPISIDYIQKHFDKVRNSRLNTKALSKFNFSKKIMKERYVYYQLKRRETLMDVLDKFPDVTLDDLMEMNNLKKRQRLRPGSRIIIKKL